MTFGLKHIPCPAGNKCTAFQCIFGHEHEKSPAPPPVTDKTVHNAVKEEQAGPRKRQRLDSQSEAPDDGNQKRKRSDEEPRTILDAATRPISPPAVKRKRDVVTVPQSTASGSSAASAVVHKLQAKPSTAKAAAAPAAESLNPRLLKAAPASHEIRFKLVRMLHQQIERLNAELRKDANDEEARLVLTAQEMIIRALDEEQRTATEKPAVYSNLMKNKVMQHKKMTVSQWKEVRVAETKGKGPEKAQGDESGWNRPVPLESGLTPQQDVEVLRRLLTPIDALGKYGYVPSIPTAEDIQKSRQGVEAAKGWEKCDRCQQRFQVFAGRREEDGALTSGGSCMFHWGKQYVPQKAPGDTTRKPKRFHCCGEEVGDSAGCFTRDHHVFKTGDPKRLAGVLNFAETPENLGAVSGRAVCFDCEMAYTVHGMELIRLTATSWPDGEELLDVLVKPLGEILDLNSRFSGVWPEDMAQAKPWTPGDDLKPSKSDTETGSEDGEVRKSKGDIKIVPSPEVARDLLFSLISPSTPLIGHGLENDLNAARIVHPTLVDTILLYPHKAGLPFRHGLKQLMDLHLNRKIQQETGPKMLGHDSAEDARAAGELARYRVKGEWKEMQRAGWKVEDGSIVAPPNLQSGVGELTEAFIES